MEYVLFKKCEEAVEALENSVYLREQALNIPMDDVAKKNIDSTIQQFRKTELERIRRKCNKVSKYK